MTRLLLAWRAGDETALARLTPLIHQELQRIARGCMRGERARDSFQATALVHEAYLRLDERRSRVVELRFFGGLSVEKTAAVLMISPQTVMRDWKLTRTWLRRELRR